jgi:Fis family transcriptional regulator
MDYAEGNQTKAAELLGINRNTLRNKLAKHRIK